MDQEMRKTICRLVAGIIVSDDELNPDEDDFINRLLAEFGFKPSDRALIFPIIDEHEAMAAMEELPVAAKEEAMRHLLDAACADGVVVAGERAYLHAVAGTLGVDPEETDRMINVRLSFG